MILQMWLQHFNYNRPFSAPSTFIINISYCIISVNEKYTLQALIIFKEKLTGRNECKFPFLWQPFHEPSLRALLWFLYKTTQSWLHGWMKNLSSYLCFPNLTKTLLYYALNYVFSNCYWGKSCHIHPNGAAVQQAT